METPGCLFRGQNEGDNEPVETQDLGENQDEDHAHKEPGLLSRAPHAGVAHDADGKTCRQAAEAHAEPGAQMQEAPEHRRDGYVTLNTSWCYCIAYYA